MSALVVFNSPTTDGAEPLTLMFSYQYARLVVAAVHDSDLHSRLSRNVNQLFVPNPHVIALDSWDDWQKVVDAYARVVGGQG